MDRLTAEDQLMLWPDKVWPQDVGALVVLDGPGRPLWVDDGAFELASHVQVCEVPLQGDEAALLQTVERLRRRRLDMSRPP